MSEEDGWPDRRRDRAMNESIEGGAEVWKNATGLRRGHVRSPRIIEEQSGRAHVVHTGIVSRHHRRSVDRVKFRESEEPNVSSGRWCGGPTCSLDRLPSGGVHTEATGVPLLTISLVFQTYKSQHILIYFQ